MKIRDATELHRKRIVIDAVCPLVMENPEFLDWYIEGGATAIAPTVGSTERAEVVLARLGAWHRLLGNRSDIMLVKNADDIVNAKSSRKLGIYFHIQGTDPIENNLDFIDLYKALGVGIIQLTYNERNRAGDGCEEPENGGLSRFGVRLIDRLNEARVIVDCSHASERTSREAVERSRDPVVLSHSNARAVFDTPRNVSDDLIRAVGSRGGVIGVAGFPGMVSGSVRPSIDEFVQHIDHISGLVGVDHVALGLDYYAGQAGVMNDEEALTSYRANLASGIWTSAYPVPPHHYPAGIETPATLVNLTQALADRGYSDRDIAKFLGENWMTVFRRIWASTQAAARPQ